MGELVCLKCGGEMEHDWAPCPKCGWKAPADLEEASEEPEEGTAASRHAVLARPRLWIFWTAFGLLVVTLSAVLAWLFK